MGAEPPYKPREPAGMGGSPSPDRHISEKGFVCCETTQKNGIAVAGGKKRFHFSGLFRNIAEHIRISPRGDDRQTARRPRTGPKDGTRGAASRPTPAGRGGPPRKPTRQTSIYRRAMKNRSPQACCI